MKNFLSSGAYCCVVFIAINQTLFAGGFVPDELESSGGNSVGLAGGGGAALDDYSAVRINPAMLASSSRYQVAGTYFWPSLGRDFFQVGVVDGTNKSLVAGLSYTAYQDEFIDPYGTSLTSQQRSSATYDSRTKRKISVGLASTFSKVALGITGSQVEGHILDTNSFEYSEIKAFTLNLGAAALFSKSLRVGLSIENLNNKKVRDIAPTAKRFGVAYLMDGGRVSLHADLVERKRVFSELGGETSLVDVLGGASEPLGGDAIDKDVERRVIISGTASVQNMLRLSLGYASEIDTGDRAQLAGGIAIVSDGYTLSYQASNPYLENENISQAVSLMLTLKM